MTPAALKAARASLGLTQVQLAKALGVARIRIARYESGDYPVPEYIALAIEALRKRQAAV